MSDKSLDELAAEIMSNAVSVATQYMGEKIKRQNILNYNGANLSYTHAKDMAQKLGLSDEDRKAITPYPGNNTMLVALSEPAEPQPQQKPQSSLASMIAPALAGAALTGGGFWAGSMLGGNDETPPPPPVVQPDTTGQVGLEIE